MKPIHILMTGVVIIMILQILILVNRKGDFNEVYIDNSIKKIENKIDSLRSYEKTLNDKIIIIQTNTHEKINSIDTLNIQQLDSIWSRYFHRRNTTTPISGND